MERTAAASSGSRSRLHLRTSCGSGTTDDGQRFAVRTKVADGEKKGRERAAAAVENWGQRRSRRGVSSNAGGASAVPAAAQWRRRQRRGGALTEQSISRDLGYHSRVFGTYLEASAGHFEGLEILRRAEARASQASTTELG
ncbi:hypothetical protein Syun_014921 [Stephania yunnanensis]|uniref:Uncharacterized protein n=1 Tax=Stephania yunnanensis TaxID=152371 RepID=A0AAP0JK80_9MAGN